MVKADQCAQYVDDIGIAANFVTQLIRNIRAVFECIRQAGFKLPIEKCQFGVTQFEILGSTITLQGIAPQNHKIHKFLAIVRFTKSKKQVQRHIGFVNYYCNYIPRLSNKLLVSYELLRADRQIKVTEELLDIPKAECNSKNNWTMHCRRHDKTRLFANTNPIRKRFTVPIRSRRGNNADTRNPNQPCIYEAGTNNWNFERTHASIKTALKISTGERLLRRKSSNCSHELQYDLSRNPRLQTVHSVPRTNTLQRT